MTTLSELNSLVRSEIQDWVSNNPEDDDIDHDGSLSEIVDSTVPVYNAELLQLAADNNRLATAEPELGPAFSGCSTDGTATPVNIIAANIYEHLSEIAWETFAEEREAIEADNAK
jgi:hypothetical protein